MKLNLRPNNWEFAKFKRKLSILNHRAIDTVIYSSVLYNLFIHIILVTCSADTSLAPTSNHYNQPDHIQQQANVRHRTTSQSNDTTTLPARDVSNLHLISDFRAVKLRWNYEQSDKNQPASFDVRFCELTSWNIEIKCRHRNMMVAHGTTNQPVRSTGNSLVEKNTPVIMTPAPIDTVHQLEPTNGSSAGYEAQIFDLRALTNYTFQVQVSRFEHEPIKLVNLIGTNNLQTNKPSNRIQSARRLEAAGDHHRQHLVGRIETKPFGAEATKCLADVSEVLINTGRYFGGRISVEDSNDPRCHLIGNKSSEQSTYLFKIDHEICASKIVDGKRIETMVLVHENKDILTHNTARFLVLCNFLQKSFTLKASVSLPKVNAVLAPNRPAVITSLPRYKLNSNEGQTGDSPARATSVMLGTMPGIYRTRVAHANMAADQQGSSADQSSSNLKRAATKVDPVDHREDDANQHHATSLKPAVNNRQPLDELETNTIERKFAENDSLQRLLAAEGQAAPMASVATATTATAVAAAAAASPTQSRQSKELGFTSAGSRRDSNGIDGSQARSMLLQEPDQVNSLPQESGNGNKLLAQPSVRVQSKVLYIEREDAAPAKTVRLLQQNLSADQPQQEQQDPYNRLGQHTTTTNSAEHSSQIDTPEPRMPTTSALASMAASSPPSHFGHSPAITAIDRIHDSRRSKQLAKLTDDESAADLQAPIIITNNHRISGNYLPVAQAAAAAAAAASSSRVSKLLNGDGGNNFTIKYSADRIDDFPVGNQDDGPMDDGQRKLANPGLWIRARSGRMRSMASDLTALMQHEQHRPGKILAAPTVTTTTTTTMAPWDLNTVDMKQPSWSVNRMGETFGGSGADGAGGDLMAETSNETTSQVIVSSSNSSTLAQNITGAILRWSLKTLTNLARKSLESLMNDTTTSTVPDTEPNFATTQPSFELDADVNRIRSTSPDSAKNFPHASLMPTSQRSSPPATSASTRRVLGTTQATTVKSNEPASESNKLTTINPNQVDLRPFEEKLADGFITSGRQSSEGQLASTRKPSTTTSTSTNHPRLSNYSKSLDLSRIGDPTRQKMNASSERNTRAPVNQSTGNKHQTLTNNSPIRNEKNDHSNESPWSSRVSGLYSNWIFYGILLLVALVTTICLILCLVSTTPNRSRSRSALNASADTIRPLGFKERESVLATGLVFGSSVGDPSYQSRNSMLDSTYQKYDYNKFENYSSDTINNRIVSSHPANGNTGISGPGASSRFGQHSPSQVSHSTRSTSVNSARMNPDETDCKNNEFLYTEHVLINTGPSFGESYA